MKSNKKIFFIIFAFIGVFIFLLSDALRKPVTNLDEIWNFNISNQIANGLIPYKNISMITTPLFASIIAIFLKIFQNELIAFRFITAIISTLICFLTYKIFSKLIKKEIISAIFTGIFIIIYYEFFSLDYNFGILLINLIILFLELRSIGKENKKIQDLIIGILAMFAILTKQTVGFFIALEVIGFKLIRIEKKGDIIPCIKEIGIRILGMIIPAFIFIIYLLATNSFNEFVDYTILGINTFSNTIPYFKLLDSSNIFVKVASIVTPLFLICTIIASFIFNKRKKKQESKILYISSLSMLIIVYPIADNVHFLISIYISLVFFLYLTYKLLVHIYNIINWKVKKSLAITAITFFTLMLIVEGAINIYKNFNEYSSSIKNTNFKHYNNLIIDDNLTNRINDIANFEKSQNKNVYVLDAEAAVYHIPQNKYFKNYDMFNKGNFGGKGEKGIIENIQDSKDSIYLIKNPKYKTNWQHPSEVTNYVKENLKYQGEINMYSIYYKE